MCGIAGICTQNTATPSVEILRSMADSIAHRGPDDYGYYAQPQIGLAHRRLSIIDLTDTGHQPMTTEDGAATIVYNGEVYNYQQLKRELEKDGVVFKGTSDTEVVLRGYLKYGHKFVQSLEGMFAFAIWNQRTKTLFAARDRIGIKPFYYRLQGGSLIFASEIKAILCHPEVSFEANHDAIREYLYFGYSLTHQTWFKGIQQLPPGNWLKFQDGSLEVQKYWSLNFQAENSVGSYGEACEELQYLLKKSVQKHLVSDVPVGAYLSGGVDSSSVVAIASQFLTEPMHTFSGAFLEGKQYDERPYANIVAKAFHTIHHEVVPDASELSSLFGDLIWYLDEPVIGAAIIPMYFVCREIRRSGIKVANGGQGADEMFSGYPPMYIAAARSLWSGGISRSKPFTEWLRVPEYLIKGGAVKRALGRLRNNSDAPWILPSFSKGHALRDLWQECLARSGTKDAMEQEMYRSLTYYLPGLLQQEDRMSMASSVESRVPLLDTAIVEFAATLPSWYKIRGGVLKAILRDSVRGIVPDAILNRRDKKGYPTPISVWFRGALSKYLEDSLLGQELLSSIFVDRDRVRQMIHQHREGKYDHGYVLWQILSLELWLRGNTSREYAERRKLANAVQTGEAR